MRAIFQKSIILMGFIASSMLAFAERPILYIYKHDGAPDKDGVYQYLLSQGKEIEARKATDEKTLPSRDAYAAYEWVLMSEDADADNTEVLELTRGYANLPVLNMKAFSYTPDRLGWGNPYNGSVSDNGCYITVQRADHPIFQALGKQRGDRIRVLSSINEKGLMPIDVNLPGTHCLATSLTRDIEEYEGDGEPQTFLHEVPASVRGGKKYICFPIALSSSNNLTSEGKALLNAIIDYLLNDEPTVSLPTLQITSFALEGVDGVTGMIDQNNNTIHMEVDLSECLPLDQTAIRPIIEVGDSYTHVKPFAGETVDLSQSTKTPVDFTVSDFINRRTYAVSVWFHYPEGIENIYSAGEWVNIYDIYGRKIGSTNNDIYRMALPCGVYIITTDKGAAFKVMR